MTGGWASAVFGETLCLPARSPASRSLAEDRRFGEGRAAPLPVTLKKRNTLKAISQFRKPGYPFVSRPAVQGYAEDHTGRVASQD